MSKLTQLFRIIQIYITLLRYTINRKVISPNVPFLHIFSYLNPWSFKHSQLTRGESIRRTLESLGPIFVKFGQLLSTRVDLIPIDIIKELEKLQDNVPPFNGILAKNIIEHNLGKPIGDVFVDFNEKPLASASVAQVHTAQFPDGREIIIKVIRPKIHKVIDQDIKLMYTAAKIINKIYKDALRLHLNEVIEEFEKTIHDELDLLKEAANASQLRRNFKNSDKMYVPEIYWDYCYTQVMVMERIYGVQISDVKTLKDNNTNMKDLAESGVEIFFTQVLRDSFFHADMHPGNLFVDISNPRAPKYIGVDFGIMGTLSPEDQRYLAENFLAFFQRNYRRVALLHIESGWVPANTRVDQLESSVRAVCEPIFERPLCEISFGKLLLRLFQVAQRFQMEVQPQLLLLQKTLFNIESMGRQLYPELDLWKTAKPLLEKFMREMNSPTKIFKQAMKNFPLNTERASEIPNLAYQTLLSMQTYYKANSKQNPSNSYNAPSLKKKKSNLFSLGIILILIPILSFLFTLSLPASFTIIGFLCLILYYIKN